MFWHSEFRPLQPKPPADFGSYKEMPPNAALNAYLYCIWELDWNGVNGKGPAYYIVPDGTTDLLFTYDRGELQAYVSVTGTVAQSIDLPPETCWLGFRFFPGAFAYMFSLSLEGLDTMTMPVSDLLPPLDLQFLASLQGQPFPQIIENVQAWLGRKAESQKACPDRRILGALQQLHDWRLGFQVNRDLESYLSQRQTRRRIEEATGLSPKRLWRVFRFQQILRDPQARHGFFAMPDLGYTDQAHFIHDFKRLTGKTPGAFWLDEG